MQFQKLVPALLACCMVVTSAIPITITTNAAEYARASVHDPSIVKLEDGSYYIIGSHLSAARSDDLENWTSTANSHLGSTNTTFFNDIYTDLAVPEKWSNTTDNYDLAGNLWALDILYNPSMGN